MTDTRKPLDITSRTAELIGANATLHLRRSDVWAILEALDGEIDGMLLTRAELAETLRTALSEES